MIQDARGWCTGMTQRDGMGREVGGGFRMGNTCKPVADSCWCVAKPIQYCKVKKKKLTLANTTHILNAKYKECSNYLTIALISHTSKVMVKILQARLQQYMNHELPDVQAGLRKGRGTRDQIANIHWIIKKARALQKNIYFCFMTMPKPLTVWITTNCGKYFKRWEYLTTVSASWEICMQVKKQQLEPDMEQ